LLSLSALKREIEVSPLEKRNRSPLLSAKGKAPLFAPHPGKGALPWARREVTLRTGAWDKRETPRETRLGFQTFSLSLTPPAAGCRAELPQSPAILPFSPHTGLQMETPALGRNSQFGATVPFQTNLNRSNTGFQGPR